MLMTPRNTFGYVTGNVLTSRPVVTVYGTSVTPAQNAYGSYASLGGTIARDCYELVININTIFSTGRARDSLTTIGIDTAGGTSYVDLIPNLLSSCAYTYGFGPGGHWYKFPIFIPAGSNLAAKGSVNDGTVGTQRVTYWAYGAPSHPENIIYGHGVESIGITTASSSGTAVTSGTTSEGAWTSLGTTTHACFAWQMGMGVNDSTMALLVYNTDLSYGDGTNNTMIIQDKRYNSDATENLGSSDMTIGYCEVPAGGTMYGRLQCSGTPDSSLSLAAYGVY